MNEADISLDISTSKKVAIDNGSSSLQETQLAGKLIKKSPKHICSICNKHFVRRSVLLRHSKIHLNIKPFRCKFCERKFLRKDNFATHMKSILAHNFECGCDRCCIHFCFHLIHDQSLENNESKCFTYQCSMCAETFQSIPDSKNHFFKSHKEEAKLLLQYNQSYFAQKLLNGSSKLLSCIICDQKFTSTKMMEEHKCEKDPDSAVIIIALDMDLDTPPQNVSYDDILEKFGSADNYSANNEVVIKEKVTVSNDLENEEPCRDKAVVASLDTDDLLYYCEVCNKKLKSQEAKLAHEMMHKHGFHKNIPCGVCSRVFCEYSKLVRHIFVHTGSKPFRCKSCCKGFNQRFQLTNHEVDCLKKSTISADSESLKQTDCKSIKQADTENRKQSNNEACMKVSNNKTKSRKGLDCHICHKYIADHSKMDRHLRSHSGPKPYACKYCFRRFAKMEHLRIHEDAYCSVKPQGHKVALLEQDESDFSPHTSLKKGIPCKVCKKSFTEYSKLIKHMQSHDSNQKVDNEKERIKSDDKQMDFLVLEPQADENLKDISIEDSKIVVDQSLDCTNEVFCCKICGKNLSSKEAEMAHEMMHKHGCNKNIPCGICKTPFPEYSKLVRHLIKHTGSKPFTCKYCNKRFAHKCHLSCHEVAYCLKKPKEERSEFSSQLLDKKCLQCYICHKRFAEHSKLIRHLKTHSGSKAFGCQYCPARFSKKAYLSIHERTNCMLRLIHKGLVEKNEDRPDGVVSCKTCDKKFYCYENMKQHLLSHSSTKPSSHNSLSQCTKSVDIISSKRATDCSGIEMLEDSKDTNQDDGNKPYMCQPCHKSFCTESEFTNHIAIHHESSRPFTCCLCEVEFEFGDSLSSHFDQFHTQNNLLFQSLLDINNPIKCNLCQKAFLSLNHFHTHLIAVHPDKKCNKYSIK